MLSRLSEQFQIAAGYLNSASRHPFSRAVSDAVSEYARSMQWMQGTRILVTPQRDRIRELFAQLINASPDEVALIPSSTAGENLVLAALDVPGSRGGVVTDALHFPGSLHMYGALARRGMPVKIVRPVGNRIRPEDVAAAIDAETRLIALSLVSATTGFQHDLKVICELAHARGVLVYADIVQAVGASPIDVKATGVDFCACASYKWLMADEGIGFLYVRGDVLSGITTAHVGGEQIRGAMQTHVLPFEPPSEDIVSGERYRGARGAFEMGTLGASAIVALAESLPLLLDAGVEEIEAHRQPLLRRLQSELPRLGFISLTPEDSRSAIAAFAFEDASEHFISRLKAAGIVVSVYPHRIRISPSVFNEMADVERLLEALA